MKNNNAQSSTLSSKAKTSTNKKSAKKTASAKKETVLTNSLELTGKMQERLEKFQKSIKNGVATRSELKAANKKLFGKKSSPSFITKNVAFKTEVTGLYSLVAQSGAKATASAVKAYLEAKETAAAESATA